MGNIKTTTQHRKSVLIALLALSLGLGAIAHAFKNNRFATPNALSEGTHPSTAVLFVVANYRSFNAQNIQAFTAISTFLKHDKLQDDSVFGLMHYAMHTETLTATSALELRSQIPKLKQSDVTIPRLFPALKDATAKFDKLDPNKRARRYLVLLSDGRQGSWECGDYARRTERVSKRAAAALKEAQVHLSVIGYDPIYGIKSHDLTTLERLAAMAGGTYYSAPEPDGLAFLMEDIYNTIYNVSP